MAISRGLQGVVVLACCLVASVLGGPALGGGESPEATVAGNAPVSTPAFQLSDESIPKNEVNLAPLYDVIETGLDTASAVLDRDYPGTLIRSEIRHDEGILYLKGDVPSGLLALLDSIGAPIRVVDNLPFSDQELRSRVERFHSLIMDTGAVKEAASYATVEGFVVSEVTLKDGAALLPDVASRLPEEVLEVSKIAAAAPRDGFVRREAAFAGMRMKRSPSGDLCTSGFVIDERYGSRRGILTAAHCTGLNQIVHPGHATHSTTHQEDHEGDNGDIEWHTTSETKPARFYADGDSVRNVYSVDLWPVSMNQFVGMADPPMSPHVPPFC